ncbi:MAG: hemerythrin domain-containing protein [Bacteroidales bacterium]|jgi:hemerythrin-like domain-containing protein|nr:hemerythrin domain-containing protein [Bacteroidales bacterium]
MTPTEDLINEHKAIKVMLSIMAKIAEDIKANKKFYIKDVEQIVDFLQTFADKCHHGKEETSLFPALVLAGIPKENGPIGVMLHEHTLGRGYIKEISNGLENCKIGNPCSSELIAANLTNYVNLLQNHIHKEENVLFPIANKALSEQKQKEIFKQFEKIEEEVVGHGVHEKYHELLNQLKSKYLGLT